MKLLVGNYMDRARFGIFQLHIKRTSRLFRFTGCRERASPFNCDKNIHVTILSRLTGLDILIRKPIRFLF